MANARVPGQLIRMKNTSSHPQDLGHAVVPPGGMVDLTEEQADKIEASILARAGVLVHVSGGTAPAAHGAALGAPGAAPPAFPATAAITPAMIAACDDIAALRTLADRPDMTPPMLGAISSRVDALSAARVPRQG